MSVESKHVVKFRMAHLQQGEIIVSSGDGYIGDMMGKGKKAQHNGSLIVTGSRVAFYRKGLFGEVLETIPLKSITSIERKSFMGHRSICIHTSHDSLEFKGFKKDKEQLLVDGIEAGRRTDNISPVTVISTESGDAMSALGKLAELKNAGVLTEEEFATKKAELLAKI
ncbi:MULTISPECIES: SHOCT domain-containing protein [Pseudomonas chlororaphis group]|uniref:SHOCT domain-containing protein n=1 Tax=Pseudomonas chlororaphis group TaxID=136842 RepID=UPI00209819B7|nr:MULTISPECIES: SHOCT domain-containing protein [Pseudomonas chlororaphis group]MCO7576167.1 SHOCT domain-containing protein [Pseudomonas protegens]MCO7580995.1 SHOCT domain-containing protein [Pseudomonas chlororaphis]MCO7597980.1 SHOCT domain-containing protein [Pseudomonas chlororaphis]